MDFNDSLVYRKTELGQAEYRQRVDGLPARLRSVLIMVNAVDNVSTLCQKMGMDLRPALAELAARAYIDVTPVLVPSVLDRPLERPNTETPRPAPLPDRELSDSAGTEQWIELRATALRQLMQHFGPDTTLIAKDMLKAQTRVDFEHSLDAIADKLAIYLGRQAARKMVDRWQP